MNEEKNIGNLGDECQIIIPSEPVDCSRLGYFDELEEECWDLVKLYCKWLGIELVPDEDGEIPISFDIAKSIQDTILNNLEEAGVQFVYDAQNQTNEITM